MAARLNLNHDEETRRKIQTTQLIKRLETHVFNEREAKISATQMKAIEILLRKALPDLASVQISGDEDNPLALKITWDRGANGGAS